MTIFEELSKFNFTQPTMNYDQKEFVTALKVMTEGKERLSTDILKRLYAESKDS